MFLLSLIIEGSIELPKSYNIPDCIVEERMNI